MRRKSLGFIAFFLSLSIYFSCIDEGVDVPGGYQNAPETELLAYAKKLVGENGEGCSLIDLQKGNSNSRTVTDYSTIATPLWEKAKTERHGDEEVLVVPLQSEDEIHSSMYFEEEHKDRLYKTKTFSRLIIRKKNGETYSQVFTYLPSRHYAKNRQEVLDTMGFSPLAVKYYGTILISGLDGKFQQGFFYERGVPTIHFTPQKHTHTHVSRSVNDTTECNNHEHSHSIKVRLNLSGNPIVASRSYSEGDETDLICMFCGESALTCSCNTVIGNYVYCGTCGNLIYQCVCSLIDYCPICGMSSCVCTYYVCNTCKQTICICEQEQGCRHCGSLYCNGWCQGSDNDEQKDDESGNITIEELKSNIIEQYGQNCGLVAALEKTNGLSNLKGIEELEFLEASYAYDSKNKFLLVPKGWDGDISRTAFPEELVHYLQDHIYSGGIGQYANGAGKSNIEFEAKVITDLILLKKRRELTRNECKVLIEDENNKISTSEYNKFLRTIRKGKMKTEDYTKFLNDFSKYAKNGEYKNNVKTDLEPLILKEYGSKFTSNKCGTDD